MVIYNPNYVYIMIHRQVPIPVPCVNFTPIILNGFVISFLSNLFKIIKFYQVFFFKKKK